MGLREARVRAEVARIGAQRGLVVLDAREEAVLIEVRVPLRVVGHGGARRLTCGAPVARRDDLVGGLAGQRHRDVGLHGGEVGFLEVVVRGPEDPAGPVGELGMHPNRLADVAQGDGDEVVGAERADRIEVYVAAAQRLGLHAAGDPRPRAGDRRQLADDAFGKRLRDRGQSRVAGRGRDRKDHDRRGPRGGRPGRRAPAGQQGPERDQPDSRRHHGDGHDPRDREAALRGWGRTRGRNRSRD